MHVLMQVRDCQLVYRSRRGVKYGVPVPKQSVCPHLELMSFIIFAGLQIDYKNIARVISDTTQKPADKVQDDMNNRTTLNPQEAKDYGLVHQIKSKLFPIDADLSVVGENLPQPQPFAFPMPVPGQQIHVQHMTMPKVEGFTRSADLDYGTSF